MRRLLVIDDEQSVLYSFEKIFQTEQTRVLTAETAAAGLRKVRKDHPDVVVLDLQLPDGSGLDVFREIRESDPKKPVIFITAHGTTEKAIEAMKNGAFDYLVKPVDLERLSQILERAFDAARLMNVPAVMPIDDTEDRIVGRSLPMQEMCKVIGRIAAQDVNVLILGESGTGKELVARALYNNSSRADKALLAINCAAIPESLLESELFGHEEGAFTGALRRRIGKFEQCQDGTLFLDEIGDMTPSLQAKMLRVLQEQRFERLGGNQTLLTNVRIVAATNQDLESLVQQGKFRKDLYYRLKGITIAVPPLRERLDDLPELAHYFMFRFNRQLKLDFRGFDPEVLRLLQTYSWPGNVRELQSVVRETMLHASGPLVLAEFLPASVRNEGRVDLPVAGTEPDVARYLESLLEQATNDVYAKLIERLDRFAIPRVLLHTGGNQRRASEILGFNRGTLRTKMRNLGIAMERVMTRDADDKEKS